MCNPLAISNFFFSYRNKAKQRFWNNQIYYNLTLRLAVWYYDEACDKLAEGGDLRVTALACGSFRRNFAAVTSHRRSQGGPAPPPNQNTTNDKKL